MTKNGATSQGTAASFDDLGDARDSGGGNQMPARAGMKNMSGNILCRRFERLQVAPRNGLNQRRAPPGLQALGAPRRLHRAAFGPDPPAGEPAQARRQQRSRSRQLSGEASDRKQRGLQNLQRLADSLMIALCHKIRNEYRTTHRYRGHRLAARAECKASG